MTRTLAGFDSVERIHDAGGTYVFELEKERASIYLAWSETGEEFELTNLGGTSVKLTESVPTDEFGEQVTDFDAAFNTETIPTTGGAVTLTLGRRQYSFRLSSGQRGVGSRFLVRSRGRSSVPCSTSRCLTPLVRLPIANRSSPENTRSSMHSESGGMTLHGARFGSVCAASENAPSVSRARSQ